jgi:hypothetical protein
LGRDRSRDTTWHYPAVLDVFMHTPLLDFDDTTPIEHEFRQVA